MLRTKTISPALPPKVNTESKPIKSTSPQPTPPPPIPNSMSNSSIKSRRKSIIRIKPTEKVEEVKKEIHYGNESYTEDKLVEIWDDYAKQVKANSGGFSGSVLANCQPKLLDNNKIHVIFRTETNLQEFIKLSENLLTHLKSTLKNNFIEFETEVNKEKAKKILYTNKEKFDHFSETYPKLKEWEAKLGLELK